MTVSSPAVEACPACGALPSSALLCERCGALLEPLARPTPFAILGLQAAFVLAPEELKKRLLALSRALHPDFHAASDAETRRLAQDNTSALNAAFQLLSDDFRRADWLVNALGGPREEDERAMPAAFLEDVLEWNETIEEARGAPPTSPARARLQTLTETLRRARTAGMQRIAATLTPLPPPGAPTLRGARQELNALRYLDRALRELGELRLDQRT